MHENDHHIYQIEIQGYLDPSWSEWFNGFKMVSHQELTGASTTTLTGIIADQPALRGILGKLWDLNLSIISIYRIELNQGPNGGKNV